MGLYRNIAGVGDNSMGLSLLPPTTARFPPIEVLPGVYNLPNRLEDPAGYAAEMERIRAAAAAMTVEKYNYLLTTALPILTDAGYYVSDNGSIFVWTDPLRTTSTTYLALQDIQNIENAAGTAGTLLLHLQQPALAKDTAGYAGGGSKTFGSDTTYSIPIQEVEDLPPVTADESGNPVLEYTGPSTSYPPTTSVPVTTTQTTTTLKNNIAPLVAVGGLLAIAIAGQSVIGKRTNLLFAGGVGALFYLMVKRNK